MGAVCVRCSRKECPITSMFAVRSMLRLPRGPYIGRAEGATGSGGGLFGISGMCVGRLFVNTLAVAVSWEYSSGEKICVGWLCAACARMVRDEPPTRALVCGVSLCGRLGRGGSGVSRDWAVEKGTRPHSKQASKASKQARSVARSQHAPAARPNSGNRRISVLFPAKPSHSSFSTLRPLASIPTCHNAIDRHDGDAVDGDVLSLALEDLHRPNFLCPSRKPEERPRRQPMQEKDAGASSSEKRAGLRFADRPTTTLASLSETIAASERTERLFRNCVSD